MEIRSDLGRIDKRVEDGDMRRYSEGGGVVQPAAKRPDRGFRGRNGHNQSAFSCLHDHTFDSGSRPSTARG